MLADKKFVLSNNAESLFLSCHVMSPPHILPCYDLKYMLAHICKKKTADLKKIITLCLCFIFIKSTIIILSDTVTSKVQVNLIISLIWVSNVINPN